MIHMPSYWDKFLKKFFKSKSIKENTEFKNSSDYLTVSQQDTDFIKKSFGQGLTNNEAYLKLKQHGKNELSSEKVRGWFLILFEIFKNPIVILSTIITIILYITHDIRGTIVVGLMIALNVVLTLFQERKSNNAVKKLRSMVSVTATVIRRSSGNEEKIEEQQSLSKQKEISIHDLVPEDVISLSAGDIIPADIRLLTCRDLFLNQSTLTGESLPVEKDCNAELPHKQNILELRNICYAGSAVVSGVGTGVVIKTGQDCFLGSLANQLAETRVATNFERGVQRFTWMMIRIMFVMVVLVFCINSFMKGNLTEAFVFAIAVAVGLTPEMLPMIVTVNLAKGALSMSRKKVIVKRLTAIQNLGAMNLLCTDKTGTLTQNIVILERYIDVKGQTDERVLHFAYLNSYYQTGLKNLLDKVVLEHVNVHSALNPQDSFKKVDEIPFDFSRRRMSVVVEDIGEKHILICKGAIEEVFRDCHYVEVNQEIKQITESDRASYQNIAIKLGEDGFRVLALAYKEMPLSQTQYTIKDESEMILLGYIAFYDPPKDSAIEAIQSLNHKGITVKILTGDNEVVTKKIAALVGIPHEKFLLGEGVDKLTDDELILRIEDTFVFAKLSPSQKNRLVRLMQQKGHVVGFMGDGINDALALKTADVGISVDNAVDIAKESADIILLEKNLLVLKEGVIEGRKVFGNIIKYVKMGSSGNFGNVFSMLGASMLLPFLPLQPIQLLFQNLLYDLSQTVIPFDQVDEEYLAKPQSWSIKEIEHFMYWFGPVSSLFDYALFGIMWFFYGANNIANQALFQTGWFVEALVSQTLVIHIIRTNKIPFIQSTAAWPLIFTTIGITGIGIYLPYSPLAKAFGFVPLPASYFLWLTLIMILYTGLAQVVKSLFVKKYFPTSKPSLA